MREGTLFEFDSADALLHAADALRALGYTHLDAYTPYPVPELEAKLGIPRTRIPYAVFAAATMGLVLAFGIMWATNAWDYPLDVGGRPLNSLPADIPIMFETTVLFGSLAAFLLVFLRSGLPRLSRAIFEVEGIERVSVDGFWIGVVQAGAIEAEVRTQMMAMGARAVRTMPARVHVGDA
jgi:hypothetical protein